MGTFFVAGVHGVGKTNICTCIAQQFKLTHYAASAMIKALDSHAVKQGTKSVDNVQKNQDLLAQAVSQFLSSGSDKLILDGHFTIPNMVGDFEVVPINVFKRLKLDAVAVCVDAADKIHARRMERDKSSIAIDKIEAIQQIELEHGKLVAELLGIPFFNIKAFDVEALIKAFHQVWKITSDL